MMKCKQCGADLEFLDHEMSDFNIKDGTMIIEERWVCEECEKPYSIDVYGKIERFDIWG